jgi:hypothetical protein
MRSIRNQVKRALKVRKKMRSEDGPECPYCEPRVNGKLKRETIRARIAQKEINDA